MEDAEKRLLLVEVKVEQHEKQLGVLHTDFKVMNATLTAIVDTLRKIQWLATGAVLIVLAQAFGLMEILKGLLGL